MKKLLIICCGAVFLVMVALFYVAFDLTRYAYAPARADADTRIVVIPSGQGFAAITRQLLDAGIIVKPMRFRLLSRVHGYDKQIKAGEYRLSAAMSPVQVLHTLIQGKVILHRVTIPEGYTYHQIAAIVAGVGYTTETEFVRVAEDTGLVGQLGVSGTTFEGYLFPDTYFFPRGTTAREIVVTMAQRFHAMFPPEWRDRAAQLNMSVHQVVTLASIIEKETGAPEERAIISSVFHNRLKKKMRLESDPTVIYGVADYNGNITRKHLRAATPYNTYRIRGLPPGPIANPGREAIHAALYPAETKYLYFVSKKNRTHQFSTNIRDHNRAVRKYQLGK